MRLEIRFPHGGNSRWSTRDNNVQLRLTLVQPALVKWQNREGDSVERKRSHLRMDRDPLRLTTRGASNYRVFDLHHAPLVINGLENHVQPLRDEWREIGGYQQVAGPGDMDSFGNKVWFTGAPQWFVDVKFGSDSPRWNALSSDNPIMQIQRVSGNHVNPWRCVRL